MIRLRRRNTVWLTVLAILVGLALLSAAAAPGVQAALLGLFVLSLAASFIEIGATRTSLVDSLQRASRNTQSRMSPQAREATERARRRGSYINDGLTLIDVGLIAMQTSTEGMVMRRTRSVSKDDDGVRPFITLVVDPAEADRNALMRFEIIDHGGQEQYIYEMRTYLRDGEMNILADHHLPLAGNQRIGGTGDWDLRVWIDGRLVGVHSFVLAPSLTERRRRVAPEMSGAEDEESFVLVESEEEDIPLSLEELLRSQSRGSQGRQGR